MENREYKKVDEKIIKETKHYEESVDELGNVIPAYNEIIDKIIPIMGWVSSEMTQEEILSLENEVSDKVEPTQLDIIEAQVMFTALMTDTLLEV